MSLNDKNNLNVKSLHRYSSETYHKFEHLSGPFKAEHFECPERCIYRITVVSARVSRTSVHAVVLTCCPSTVFAPVITMPARV